MNEKSAEVLGTVASRTDSDLILFFVIMAVIIIAIIGIAIPYFKIMAKREASKASAEMAKIKAESEADNERLAKYIQREGQIIQVVQENTKAISKLTVILEADHNNCDVCKDEQTELWRHIDKKIDDVKLQMNVMNEQFDTMQEVILREIRKEGAA